LRKEGKRREEKRRRRIEVSKGSGRLEMLRPSYCMGQIRVQACYYSDWAGSDYQ
jgi:hypothetical protein